MGRRSAGNSVASATPAAAASSASPFSLQFPKGPARGGGPWQETARSGAGLPLEEASLRHGAPHIPFAQVSRAGLRWFCNGRQGETGGSEGKSREMGPPQSPASDLWHSHDLEALSSAAPLPPALPSPSSHVTTIFCRDADSFDLDNKNTRDCKGFSQHSSP